MKTKIDTNTFLNLGYQKITSDGFRFEKGKIMVSTDDFIYFCISTGSGTLYFKIVTVKDLKLVLSHIVCF